MSKTIFPDEDRAALLSELREIDAPTVLEFGPGESTKVFFEHGVKMLVSLEHDARWLQRARGALAPLKPAGTTWALWAYVNEPKISHIYVDPMRFDLALVDSPQANAWGWARLPGQEKLARYNTLSYAVERAQVVLLHDANRIGERESLRALGLKCEMLTHKLGRVYR